MAMETHHFGPRLLIGAISLGREAREPLAVDVAAQRAERRHLRAAGSCGWRWLVYFMENPNYK